MCSPLRLPWLAGKRWLLINSDRLCCGEAVHCRAANNRLPELWLSSLPLTSMECAVEHHCASALLLVPLFRMTIKNIQREDPGEEREGWGVGNCETGTHDESPWMFNVYWDWISLCLHDPAALADSPYHERNSIMQNKVEPIHQHLMSVGQ